MRKIAIAATFIVATGFSAYATVLRTVTLTGGLTAYQPVFKSVLFHAVCGLLGATLFLFSSRGFVRMLAVIPALLAATAIWRVLQFWPQVFP